MIVSSIISLFLSLYAWRHRDGHALFPLFWLFIVTTIWSFFYGVEVSLTDLTQMKIMNSFGYIGIATIPVLWLIFAATYCGKDHWLTSFNTLLLFIIPILSIIMVATNDLHHLFYSTVELGSSGIYYFQKTTYSFFWWVHFCYSYLALLGSLVLFICGLFQASPAHRWHIGIFIISALIPFFVNCTYLAGLKPYGFLDLTPIAFIFSEIIFLLGILKIDLFDVTPLALDILFNNIPDAIIVLDPKNEVIRMNPAGKVLWQIKSFQKIVHELKATDLLRHSEKELKIGEKIYFNTNKPITNTTGKYLGTLMIIRDITKYKQLEEVLRKSREKYREIINGMNDTAWIVGFDSKFVDVNKAAIKKLGYSKEELLSMGPEDIDFNLSGEQIKALIRQMPNDGVKVFETEHTTKEGKTIPVEISSSLVTYQGRRDILTIARDISKRKQAEEALQKSREEFSSLFQSNPEAIVYTDEKGNIININSRFTELFGYSPAEIKGKNIDSGLIHSLDRMQEARDLTQQSLNNSYMGFETIRKKKDGTLVPVYISSSPVITNNKRKGVIATYYDISERKKMEEQLKKLSRIDPLTGCFNRRFGLELIERQVNLCKRNKLSLLLAFLDINNFKAINDQYGHLEGDRILKDFVYLLNTTLREVDIVCRMGGDEFLLAFPYGSLGEASLIKSRLDDKLLRYNQNSKNDYQVSYSIGFSEYLPSSTKRLDELIAIADQEMYKEKNNKKN